MLISGTNTFGECASVDKLCVSSLTVWYHPHSEGDCDLLESRPVLSLAQSFWEGSLQGLSGRA